MYHVKVYCGCTPFDSEEWDITSRDNKSFKTLESAKQFRDDLYSNESIIKRCDPYHEVFGPLILISDDDGNIIDDEGQCIISAA